MSLLLRLTGNTVRTRDAEALRVRERGQSETAGGHRRSEPSPAPATPCGPASSDTSAPGALRWNRIPFRRILPQRNTPSLRGCRSLEGGRSPPRGRRGLSARLPPKSPNRTGMLHAFSVDNTVRSPVPVTIARFRSRRHRIAPGPSAAAIRQQLAALGSSPRNPKSSGVSGGRSGRASATTVPIRTGMHRPLSVRRANPEPASPSSDDRAAERPRSSPIRVRNGRKKPETGPKTAPDVTRGEVGRPRRRMGERQIPSTLQSFSEIQPWL